MDIVDIDVRYTVEHLFRKLQEEESLGIWLYLDFICLLIVVKDSNNVEHCNELDEIWIDEEMDILSSFQKE